ncbi:MAG TPA: type II and III secretion system protein, partial [Candidatus Bilophila faecipullorum]|nr:type II and III secretion system protein [Candidatus Bilophila faecipullorum]
LSSPSITTLDNKMAYTENGEKVPYVSTSNMGDREVKFEDAVLRLEMTPNVIDGDNLKLKVLVKKDEVDTSRTVEGNPFIIKKQTETTLIMRNGETVVISGLTKEKGTDINAGVPGLKDIPGGKYVFGHDSKGKTMEEVLIFITPEILPTREVQGALDDLAAKVRPSTETGR